MQKEIKWQFCQINSNKMEIFNVLNSIEPLYNKIIDGRQAHCFHKNENKYELLKEGLEKAV